ncbi:MAG: hypothetical protein NVSMB16_01060 [Acidimicrobiales bacterium]
MDMSGASVPDDPIMVVIVIDAPDPVHAEVAEGVDAAAAIAAGGGRAAVWIGGRDEPELAEFRAEICARPGTGTRAGPERRG